MSETAIPVNEAAKDFLKLLDQVERNREPAVLLREGKAVATLNPVPRSVSNCAELAERWVSLGELLPEEASAFADDLEQARLKLPPLKSAWD